MKKYFCSCDGCCPCVRQLLKKINKSSHKVFVIRRNLNQNIWLARFFSTYSNRDIWLARSLLAVDFVDLHYHGGSSVIFRIFFIKPFDSIVFLWQLKRFYLCQKWIEVVVVLTGKFESMLSNFSCGSCKRYYKNRNVKYHYIEI